MSITNLDPMMLVLQRRQQELVKEAAQRRLLKEAYRKDCLKPTTHLKFSL